MPVYEYECADHGVFEAMNPLSRYSEPLPCPTCDASASRVISTPHLASGSTDFKARDRNERSRHEPRMVRREQPKDPSGRPALQASHGSRPWALEHG
jgi:putative FmdB family regulatory protein